MINLSFCEAYFVGRFFWGAGFFALAFFLTALPVRLAPLIVESQYRSAQDECRITAIPVTNLNSPSWGQRRISGPGEKLCILNPD
jgi:hypothetical protein